MLSPLICGSFQDQDDDLEFLRSCSQAKKSSRKPTRWHSFGGRHRDNKNPYAGRGLDKFSALLAELDSKRQKIYTQKGSEDISLLGFVCSSSNDYKPIVVRLKKQQPDKAKLDKQKENVDNPKTEATDNNSKVVPVQQPKGDAKLSRIESDMKTSPKNISSVLDRIKWKNLRRPGYYVPVIIILILVFLAIFGRSFAILCTTLGWYFIPTIQAYGSSGSSSKKMKTVKKDYVKALSYNIKIISSGGNDHGLRKTKTMKKDYVKALSYNNKIISSNDHGSLSPKSVLTGDKSPPQGGHRRSF